MGWLGSPGAGVLPKLYRDVLRWRRRSGEAEAEWGRLIDFSRRCFEQLNSGALALRFCIEVFLYGVSMYILVVLTVPKLINKL